MLSFCSDSNLLFIIQQALKKKNTSLCTSAPTPQKNRGIEWSSRMSEQFENVFTTHFNTTTYKNLHDFLLNNCVWTHFNRYKNKTAVKLRAFTFSLFWKDPIYICTHNNICCLCFAWNQLRDQFFIRHALLLPEHACWWLIQVVSRTERKWLLRLKLPLLDISVDCS